MRALELKVPPPIVALVLALLMGLTPAVAGLVPSSYPSRVLWAVVLVCVGQGIGIAGMIAFRRAKTTVNPVKASLASSLVTFGCRVRALHHSLSDHPGGTCVGVSLRGGVRGLQRQGAQVDMRPGERNHTVQAGGLSDAASNA